MHFKYSNSTAFHENHGQPLTATVQHIKNVFIVCYCTSNTDINSWTDCHTADSHQTCSRGC